MVRSVAFQSTIRLSLKADTELIDTLVRGVSLEINVGGITIPPNVSFSDQYVIKGKSLSRTPNLFRLMPLDAAETQSQIFSSNTFTIQ
jgi:hypothetical protein